VPLKECKIPTLIVFPPPTAAAGGDPVAVGEATGVAVGVGVLQAFRNKLDVMVAELYKRNLRRSNRFVILFF
jgi:hypothetical protein